MERIGQRVPNAPFAKGNMGGGTGTLTAGLVFGGADPSTTGATYEYDGTNWTAGGTMNTARNQVNGWGGPAGQTASMWVVETMVLCQQQQKAMTELHGLQDQI